MSFKDDVRQRRQTKQSASAFAGLARTAIASGKAEAKAAATKEAQKQAKAAAVLPRSRSEAQAARDYANGDNRASVRSMFGLPAEAEGQHSLKDWNQTWTKRLLDDLYGPGNWAWHWETKRFGDTNHYFTGKPCKLGHVAKRRTEDGACVACIEAKNVAIERKAVEESWFAELLAKRGKMWFRRFSLDSIQNWKKLEDWKAALSDSADKIK